MTTETIDLEKIYRDFTDLGFQRAGVAKLNTPISIATYKDWLDKDFNGSMSYLETHLEKKTNPQSLMKKAEYAIVGAYPYLPDPKKKPETAPETTPDFSLDHLKIAKYAKGPDYHDWLKEKLELIIEKLREFFPEEEFQSYVDSAPVLERDLAYRAGLGWVGKNTCLIDQKFGSFFFIGEIYTSLDLGNAKALEDQPSSKDWLHPNRCGTCTRCIDACPTEALTQPYELDARKCISYLTIESKSNPPDELKKKMGDWFYGCDICQDVCPWNAKPLRISKEISEKSKWTPPHDQDSTPDSQAPLKRSADRDRIICELRLILETSNKSLIKKLKSTPLERAGGRGLKRNALVIIENLKLVELAPDIENLLKVTSEESSLHQFARQTLENLKSTTKKHSFS